MMACLFVFNLMTFWIVFPDERLLVRGFVFMKNIMKKCSYTLTFRLKSLSCLCCINQLSAIGFALLSDPAVMP